MMKKNMPPQIIGSDLGSEPTPTTRSALLTAAEAAHRWSLRPSTLRTWATSGLIPAIRLPSGSLRFDATALDALVARFPVGDGSERESWDHRAAGADEPLLTAEDVAGWLGVSRDTVHRWRHEGLIAWLAIPGGIVRFHPADVRAALQLEER